MSSTTLEPEAMDPKLLTEIERQEAVLAELPEDYEFPLFDGRPPIALPETTVLMVLLTLAQEIKMDTVLKAQWLPTEGHEEDRRLWCKRSSHGAMSRGRFASSGTW
ncbi:MAG TPA: hypothetical protein VMS17_06180 [Gemmataceae bacterium]|nr:hypothetical protein [Gemmataceae bacterium]